MRLLTLSCLTLLAITLSAQTPATSSQLVISTYDQIIQAGNVQLKAGDFTAAHDAAMKALGLDGNRFEAYALESLALFKQGKADQAKEFIQIALAKVPAAKKPQLETLAAAIENYNKGKPPTAAPSSASTEINQLKGNDRLQYETLLSMLSDADKATDLEARHNILAGFMKQSGEFLKTHSNLERLLVARAAVAVELNRVHDGWKVGQKLKAFGLENSDDSRIQKVMTELNQKGWLTKDDPYQGPKEGQNWTVPDVSLKMNWVQPGSFTMGSPEDEKGRDNDELQHQVTLTKGFWLATFDITISQWQAIMGNNPVADIDYPSDAPITQVSWNDAMGFCRRLNVEANAAGVLPEGYQYTLPTEAQWEYACRAGTTGPYGGDGVLSDMGWYQVHFFSNSNLHSVGQKMSNAWGLYDMHGNVYEWCYDWYGPYPDGTVTDPTGPASGSLHCIRGGYFGGSAKVCRSAARDYSDVGGLVGFRVALTPVIISKNN